MTQEIINIGSSDNDGVGDPVRDAFEKTNNNFTELYTDTINPSDKNTSIYQLSDFPDPVAGVISLESGRVYELKNNVSTGSNKLVMGVGTVLRASGQTIALTFEGTGNFITSVDNAFILENITINATATGARVIDFSTTARNLCTIRDCTFNCYQFANFSGVEWGATISNIRIFPLANNGITCAGTSRSFRWYGSGVRATTGIILDLGTCVFDSVLVDSVVYNLPTGATFISGQTASANISSSGRGLVINCQGNNTGGTDLSGVAVGDARWKFSNNTPIADSRNDFLMSFETPATTTINTAGVFELVNGVYTEDFANGFTTTAAGRVTSDIVEDIQIPIDIKVSFEPVSGSNKDLALKVAINGVAQGPTHLIRIDSGSPITDISPWQVNLSENDYVEVYVANMSDTTNIQVNSLTFRGN